MKGDRVLGKLLDEGKWWAQWFKDVGRCIPKPKFRAKKLPDSNNKNPHPSIIFGPPQTSPGYPTREIRGFDEDDLDDILGQKKEESNNDPYSPMCSASHACSAGPISWAPPMTASWVISASSRWGYQGMPPPKPKKGRELDKILGLEEDET